MAEVVEDPEVDYVTTGRYPDYYEPDSDDILRLDLQLSANTKPAIFLSYEGFSDRSGVAWTVYLPTQGGYQRIDDTVEDGLIRFRLDMMFAGSYPGPADKGGILAVFPGGGKGELIRYQFEGGVARYSKLKELDFSKPQDIKEFADIFKRDITQPLPATFFEKPPYRIVSASAVRARSPNLKVPLLKLVRPQPRFHDWLTFSPRRPPFLGRLSAMRQCRLLHLGRTFRNRRRIHSRARNCGSWESGSRDYSPPELLG